MATPTLGGTPTNINNCDTDNFTGADGTDADIKREGSASVGWIARGDGDTCSFTVTNLALSTEHIRVWLNHSTVGNLDTEANGGMEMSFLDGANTGYWTLFGSDTYDGGWFNGIVYGGSTPDANSGTDPAMTSVDAIGFRFQQASLPANKINTWIDYVRYGDGYYATGGTSGDEIDLAGIASQDLTNGYGIVLQFEGAYFGYGDLTIGNGATTTWFEAVGDVLIYTDAPVNTGLYGLTAAGSGCRFTLDGAVIKAAGTTDTNRWSFDLSDTNLASVSVTNSQFTRASTTTLQSGITVTGNVFDDCGQITHAGADMDNCTIKNYEGTAGTAALVYNVNADPDGEMDGMTFEKGTAATHAIEFGSSTPASVTLRNQTYTSYNAADGQNDSTFYNNTGGALTINIIGGTGNVTYRNGSGASTTIVQNPVTLQLTVLDTGGDPISGARAFVVAKDPGPLPAEDSVTITRVNNTATVAHTAHGLSNSDKAWIEGADQTEYNGVKTISNVSTNAYDYAVTGTPTSPATGTIVSTAVIIDETTTAGGIADDTRTYSSDQTIDNLRSKVRKSSSADDPKYKTTKVTGTIDSGNGLSINVLMLEDQ